MNSKKRFFLYAVLSLFIFISCSTPDNSVPLKFYTVKFYDEDTLVQEFNVPENSKVSTCGKWNIVENYTNEEKADLLLLWYTDNKVYFEDKPVNSDVIYKASWVPVAIKTDDSYAKVFWKERDEFSNCTVTCKEGETVIASKTNCNGYAEFFGLTNNQEYTFVVTSGANSETVQGTPAISVKEPDWVVAMYVDGDNNLHDNIFLDLNEVEYGLWKIEQEPTNYDSVSVVALWDGWAGNSSKTPIFKCGEKTYLYEMGPEESNNSQVVGDTLSGYDYGNPRISETTKNLSYTAKDWLFEPSVKIEDFDTTSGGEVNMGNEKTLVNFINWVNARYNPKKGIILQFSDHGSGPRNTPEYGRLKNGKIIRLDNDGRRELCQDDNSSGSILKTSDVSNALSEAGYGSGKKIDMILMDVCLGASVEDAYQFKDYADYMVASPNTVNGLGMNYIRFMESFKKNTDIKTIGKQLIKDFRWFYQGEQWDQIAKFMSEEGRPIDRYSDLTDSEKINVELIYGGLAGVSTLSFIDLNKVGPLVTAIDDLAKTLLGKEDEVLYFTDENYRYFSESQTDYSLPYLEYMRKLLVSWQECEIYNNNALFYKGTYNWLYDIGVLTDTIKYLFSGTDVAQKAIAVQDALKSVIVSSWRDTLLTRDSQGRICPGEDYKDYGYYALLDRKKTGDYTGHIYGLTISGYSSNKRDDRNNIIFPGVVYSWYEEDLLFGEKTCWADFLFTMLQYNSN